MSIHGGTKKNYQPGITERVAVGVSGSNVVTRKCYIDVNSAVTLSYPREGENWELKRLFNDAIVGFFFRRTRLSYFQ